MTASNQIQRMGQEAPILARGTKTPDRRRVSLRWLSGTFMTGITSISLMGIALFVALEGNEQLTLPAVAFAALDGNDTKRTKTGHKTARVRSSILADQEPDKLVMDVPTLVNDGDHQIVTRRPFVLVSMPLSSSYNTKTDYPAFNPLQIFSTEKSLAGGGIDAGAIYGAKIESEIALKTIDFPLDNKEYAYAASMSTEEAEETVRTNGSILISQDSQIAALHYVDPLRFGTNQVSIFDFTADINTRVVAENVSISNYAPSTKEQTEFFEDLRSIRTASTFADVLIEAGYQPEQIEIYESTLKDKIDLENIKPGTSFRIGVEQTEELSRIVRISIYEQNRHIITAARSDNGQYVIAAEPEYLPNIAAFLDDMPNIPPPALEMPTVYDGIYKAGLSYGMTADMLKRVIKMLAAHVDFKAKVRPGDAMEAFFSVADEEAIANDESELLYISANFGGEVARFYKFTHPDDGSIDYYDENGRSARQFLLRNPTPTAIFRSPFGMRRHPITGRRKMHSGVDWAGPRGTPILASGDGIVLDAGWHSGGYGRQTKIQHANGYVSSYSHQSKISKGVVPGARVRQGQVIGAIGSTGLSTGPHLHYELIVNGTKVDPMRVRLPEGKTLEGEALARFQQERDKLNSLLGIQDEATELASN